jgi:hypothetical protein
VWQAVPTSAPLCAILFLVNTMTERRMPTHPAERDRELVSSSELALLVAALGGGPGGAEDSPRAGSASNLGLPAYDPAARRSGER